MSKEPASSLLARGVSTIETRFPGNARLQAELFGAIREVHTQLADHVRAIELGQRQLALMKQSGASDAEVALLLSQDATDKSELGRSSEALEVLDQALALAADSTELRVRLHAQRGFIKSFHLGQLDTAAADHTAASLILQRHRKLPL